MITQTIVKTANQFGSSATKGSLQVPRTRQRYAQSGGINYAVGKEDPIAMSSTSLSNGTTPIGSRSTSPRLQSNSGIGKGNVAIPIEADDNEGRIGTGQIVDPHGYGGSGRGNSAGGLAINMPNGNGIHSAPMPSRTHYRLSRTEILKGLANRFVHSTAYLYFYGSMALASLMTVFISLIQDCPGTLFYSLELTINALLIAEVGIRGYAFGKQFWKSTFNIIDLGLVMLCAITLAVLFFSHDCSPYRRGKEAPQPGEDLPGSTQGNRGGRSEELLDSFLLILRNAAQLVRLLSVVRRSSSNVTTRVPTIDLDDARRYSLDWDLEEEGLQARQRMADGGDRNARNQQGRNEEQRQLFDYEDEDDEL